MKRALMQLTRAGAAVLVGLTLVSGVAMAQTGSNVVFPAEPDRTITLENGREVHVYNATVLNARGNRLTVRFDNGERFSYTVPADYRFNIDGRMVRTRDLRRGDSLTAYVTVHQTAHHEIHHIDESGPTPVVVASAVAEPADMLPATASPLPLIGLLGALFAGLGGLGLAIRRRFA